MFPDSFTDDDIKKFGDFLNFVFNKASFTLSTKDIFEFGNLYTHAVQFGKKAEAHVFEVKKVMNNTPPAEPEKKRGKSKPTLAPAASVASESPKP